MEDFFGKTLSIFKKVPLAPTNPQSETSEAPFEVEDLYKENRTTQSSGQQIQLDEKLRQAYFLDYKYCHYQSLL